MSKVWENVVFTCSTMLLFESEEQINNWSARHNIPKGDIQPIEKFFNFAKKRDGNHLNPEWTKWTIVEAKRMFIEHDLKGKIWELKDLAGRF